MKNYVKYRSPARHGSIGFIGSGVSTGILTLSNLLQSAGWSLQDLLTASTSCGYWAAPFYVSPTNKDLYFPFTMYRGTQVIGYYDPTGDAPPANQPPYYIHWYPALNSPAATLAHTASVIGVVAPGFQATLVAPPPLWTWEMYIFYDHGGPAYNNLDFAPHNSMGVGSSTQGGGCVFRTGTYRGYYAEMSAFQTSSPNLSLTVYFGGGAPDYNFRLGQYTWTCLCNPYQLLMFASGTKVVDDVSKNATGFLISLPYVEGSIQDSVTYCGVCCGGYLPPDWYIYNSGDIGFYANRNVSKFRLNGEFSSASVKYEVSDTGLIFPVMRCKLELLTVLEGSTEPVINPAYLSISPSPSNPYSLARVVGNLWHSFTVSKTLARGDVVELDDARWVCLFSQGTSTLAQTPCSMLMLEGS